MKTKFKEFINENIFDDALNRNKEIKIYVDMDGVLTDFDGELRNIFLDKWNKDHNTNIFGLK